MFQVSPLRGSLEDNSLLRANAQAFPMIPFFLVLLSVLSCNQPTDERTLESRKDLIIKTDGLVAFWDFEHQQGGVWRSVGEEKGLPMYLRRIGDSTNYSLLQWPHKDPNSALTFDQDGPLGNAVRFNRGFIYGAVPRESFENTLLNVYGTRPFTMIAWIKFIGRRHMIAGIWDEGGWQKYAGRRQFALFGGLFGQRGVIAHVSATGAASYPQSTIEGAQYARIRAIDSMPFADHQWVAVAMSFSPEEQLVRAYLNGVMSAYHLEDPVAQDVYRGTVISAANPLAFGGPIYSPMKHTLKFNGYNLLEDGVSEHRLLVDVKEFALTYERDDQGQVGYPLRIKFDLRRNGHSLLTHPVEKLASPGDSWPLKLVRPPAVDDHIIAVLEMKDESMWRPIGSPIQTSLQEGAPFTVGRALGLASEEIEHGSELLVDGVAIFRRVLSEDELAALSFH